MTMYNIIIYNMIFALLISHIFMSRLYLIYDVGTYCKLFDMALSFISLKLLVKTIYQILIFESLFMLY